MLTVRIQKTYLTYKVFVSKSVDRMSHFCTLWRQMVSTCVTLVGAYRDRYRTPIKALAESWGTDRNSVYHLINPRHPSYRRHRPNQEVLARVASTLGVSVEEIVANLEECRTAAAGAAR